MSVERLPENVPTEQKYACDIMRALEYYLWANQTALCYDNAIKAFDVYARWFGWIYRASTEYRVGALIRCNYSFMAHGTYVKAWNWPAINLVNHHRRHCYCTSHITGQGESFISIGETKVQFYYVNQ